MGQIVLTPTSVFNFGKFKDRHPTFKELVDIGEFDYLAFLLTLGYIEYDNDAYDLVCTEYRRKMNKNFSDLVEEKKSKSGKFKSERDLKRRKK